MITNTLQSDRSPHDYERAFVEEVTVYHPVPPDPRVERFIFICWVLIAIKHLAVIWVVSHYTMPFHQLWVNAPTWLLGLVATGAYYYSLRRG
jgi:hypothetical protein